MSIGWGIVGCGDIANKAVAPAINEQADSELVAFFSHSAERAEQMRADHGARRAYSCLDEILADDEIDVIYVASPVHRHAPESIAAARAGKHVLCEKPMALNVADAEATIAACDEAGVHLAAAYYRRFFPKARKMKELLDAGAIGRPVLARVCIGSRAVIAEDNPKHWRTVPETGGGGALMDVGSHRLDLICYLLGEPAQVCGFADSIDREDMGVPDTESLLCRMKSGAHVQCTAYWCMPDRADELEIWGTEGRLVTRHFDGPELTLMRGDERESWELPLVANWHAPLVDDFARGLVEGRGPTFTGRDGILSQRIINGCYDSSVSGETGQV